MGDEGSGDPSLRHPLVYICHVGVDGDGVWSPSAKLLRVLVGQPRAGRDAVQWAGHLDRYAGLQVPRDEGVQVGEHQEHQRGKGEVQKSSAAVHT